MSLIEKRLQRLHYRPRKPATPADGSCFFHAIVELLGWEPKFYKGLRSTLCDYMEQAGIVSIIWYLLWQSFTVSHFTTWLTLLIDSLRFLGPVCYSICGMVAYLVWMETRVHDKPGNMRFICICYYQKWLSMTKRCKNGYIKIVLPWQVILFLWLSNMKVIIILQYHTRYRTCSGFSVHLYHNSIHWSSYYQIMQIENDAVLEWPPVTKNIKNM